MFFRSDSILGVSCGHGRITLTLVKGGKAKKAVWIDADENILAHSEIKSKNLFVTLLRQTLKENNMYCKRVAYSIPDSNVFTRIVTMPQMTDEQIRLNIPFEFRDFIQGELKEYLFDYAYLSSEEEGIYGTNNPVVRLFAAAVPKKVFVEIQDMFKMAGMKLVKASPQLCAFEALLRLLPTEEETKRERCFIDIGRNHTRLMIYKDGRYKLVHNIDMGERDITQAIADEMNVDMHIARTYLEKNYEECQTFPSVINVYKDISLEILKGINFYEVSDMSSRLADVTLCGGAAMIASFVTLLKERIAMNVTTMPELLPDWNQGGALNITAGSLGVVLN